MSANGTIVLLTVALCSAALSFVGGGDRTRDGDRIRVGTYDNRAIAIAYANSNEFHESLATMRQKYERAKKAGDTRAVERLERAFDRRQWLAHRQGFGRASVDEAIAAIAGKLPQVASEAGVCAVVYSPDYVDSDAVEVVDVTDAIVELFEPTERTRKMIASLKNAEVLDIGFDFEE